MKIWMQCKLMMTSEQRESVQHMLRSLSRSSCAIMKTYISTMLRPLPPSLALRQTVQNAMVSELKIYKYSKSRSLNYTAHKHHTQAATNIEGEADHLLTQR
jgi:hypothetical protein